jgi:hypothetical protein
VKVVCKTASVPRPRSRTRPCAPRFAPCHTTRDARPTHGRPRLRGCGVDLTPQRAPDLATATSHRVRWYAGGAVAVAQRLPHLTAHDVAEIDAEVSADFIDPLARLDEN